MRKTFKYRLYATKAQAESLRVQLSEACRFYNAALQERIEAYAKHRKSINYYDQAAQLTEIRARVTWACRIVTVLKRFFAVWTRRSKPSLNV